MEESSQARLYAVIEGRVQGVGFRAFVAQEAAFLNVTGWVRNRWDETVEMTAEGDRKSLEKLLAVVRRGPRGAYVSAVRQEWQPATGEFTRFRILPTN